jgi:hypothetical protein
MGKFRVKSSGSTSKNGGILGSGIFGMFGTTVQCNSNDTSMYCMLSKFVTQL